MAAQKIYITRTKTMINIKLQLKITQKPTDETRQKKRKSEKFKKIIKNCITVFLFKWQIKEANRDKREMRSDIIKKIT